MKTFKAYTYIILVLVFFVSKTGKGQNSPPWESHRWHDKTILVPYKVKNSESNNESKHAWGKIDKIVPFGWGVEISGKYTIYGGELQDNIDTFKAISVLGFYINYDKIVSNIELFVIGRTNSLDVVNFNDEMIPGDFTGKTYQLSLSAGYMVYSGSFFQIVPMAGYRWNFHNIFTDPSKYTNKIRQIRAQGVTIGSSFFIPILYTKSIYKIPRLVLSLKYDLLITTKEGYKKTGDASSTNTVLRFYGGIAQQLSIGIIYSIRY